MKVYVASSWRNDMQPIVVEALRSAGHDVYDFRNPGEGNHGFSWSEIDPAWKNWSPSQYRSALDHDRAIDGFYLDMHALEEAEAVVMVQPCGVSSALELGYAKGADKHTVVLLAPGEPELMLKMAGWLCLTVAEVIDALGAIEEGA